MTKNKKEDGVVIAGGGIKGSYNVSELIRATANRPKETMVIDPPHSEVFHGPNVGIDTFNYADMETKIAAAISVIKEETFNHYEDCDCRLCKLLKELEL